MKRAFGYIATYELREQVVPQKTLYGSLNYVNINILGKPQRKSSKGQEKKEVTNMKALAKAKKSKGLKYRKN